MTQCFVWIYFCVYVRNSCLHVSPITNLFILSYFGKCISPKFLVDFCKLMHKI